jgi:hypothetical protein
LTPSTPAIEDSIQEIYRHCVQQSSEGESSLLVHAQFGGVSDAHTDFTLRTVENSLKAAGVKRSQIKHFCNLLIEVVQNISSHTALDISGNSYAFVVVSTSPQGQRLATGNLVLASELAPLRQRLEYLSSLNSAELQKLYVEFMCSEQLNDKGGAGLGLIMLFKKLASGVRWKLLPLGGSYGYFVLELTVTR